MQKQNILHPELSYRTVGCAMDVHTKIGAGFDEPHYHLALRHALEGEGLHVEFKPSCRLVHRGVRADEFEPDLVVDDTIVPELKVLTGDFDDEHLLQVICYLKFLGKDLGMLLNFGLEKLKHRRVVFHEPEKVARWYLDALMSNLEPSKQELLSRLRDSLERLLQQYGLGYRGTTYEGLVRAELTAEGIPLVEDPPTRLSYDGKPLGTCGTHGFLVADTAFVKVVALRDQFQASEIATVRAYLRHLDLRWGLAVNFGKRCLEVHGVSLP